MIKALLNLWNRILVGPARTDKMTFPFRFSESRSDLTKWFNSRQCCPDCGATEFIGGPQGGLSQNMLCPECFAEFNICLPFMADRLAMPGEGRLHVYGISRRS